MPTLRAITSEEELHSWIRNKMQERQKAGKTLIFPSINSPHLSPPDHLHDPLASPDSSFLRKRCLELSHEKQDVLSQIDQLKADNAKLLSSSKSWFEKYQEAIQSREESRHTTPVKKRIKREEEDELVFLD